MPVPQTSNWSTCPHCDGEGLDPQAMFWQRLLWHSACPVCKGRGEILRAPPPPCQPPRKHCPHCGHAL